VISSLPCFVGPYVPKEDGPWCSSPRFPIRLGRKLGGRYHTIPGPESKLSFPIPQPSALLATATDEERRLFFQTVLQDLFVDNKKVMAIRPKPDYHNLLSLSEAEATWVEKATDIRVLSLFEGL